MTGTLYVVGLGPGNQKQITPEAMEAISAASHFFGYKPYVDRLELRADQIAVPSDNREEIDRAKAALEMAAEGQTVAVVSGGDPGIFAMASAVCEAIDHGPEHWKTVDLRVVPGVTAMLALAAKVGAPLGADFCTISLSDNLKPWDLIEKRLRLAAEAEFAIAIYNPISKARPWQLGKAFNILREILPAGIPVIFGRAVGREDEEIVITNLEKAAPEQANMASTIIVGSRHVRGVERPDRRNLMYALRRVPESST
ncbi:precorrin-3B C(17)-methyltransferase [Pelagibacterium sp. 26DY04]|uniref:precorrin-3B C(17)-methyltransferase n=1 Tax=Pelagibacterium sp. 26DY04 TaxID=2967130 RepID=UPI002815C4D9|nr:precorrin-3B C(17)-methyltransferase [Pelagibacterium sp. 26DY04]WMT88177.1 precorrin-3B C(17)-methyltransferase [Pelagibacterium sp. 26DY04]